MKVLLTIPTYNEESVLERTIITLHTYLSSARLEAQCDIEIADNGSIDRTPEIAQELSKKIPGVFYHHIERRGKGSAIRQSWQRQGYDVYLFMDADFSTDISILPHMVQAFKAGADVVVGSRLHPQSHVKRPIVRRLQTWVFNIGMKVLFGVRFSDSQIGCKGITRKAKDILLPHIHEQGLSFDIYLMVLAEKYKLKIKELPIFYVDERPGRMPLFGTAFHLITRALVLRYKLWFEKY